MRATIPVTTPYIAGYYATSDTIPIFCAAGAAKVQYLDLPTNAEELQRTVFTNQQQLTSSGTPLLFSTTRPGENIPFRQPSLTRVTPSIGTDGVMLTSEVNISTQLLTEGLDVHCDLGHVIQ